MKNIVFFVAVMLLFSISQPSQGATNTSLNTKETTTKTQFLGGGKKNKNGQYRKKKGFLWGLFRGKNACDCPKH